MAVLVLGAGMVGSQAARQLLDRGETPVLFDIAPNTPHLATVFDPGSVKVVRGDIQELAELVDVIRANNIDRIIHTAGLLFDGVRQRPYAGTKINIVGTLNVLEAAKLTGVKRVVLCSTGFVYVAVSSNPGQPIDEDMTMRMVNDRPRAFYAISKLTSEYLGLSYCEQFGVDFVGVRFGGVFGPWKGFVSGVPGRYVDQFAVPGAQGKPIVLEDPFLLTGGGGSFVYAKDAAKGTVLACFAPPEQLKHRIYNITMSRNYPIEEQLAIAGRVFPGVPIQIGDAVKGAIEQFRMGRPPAIGRARAELGYEPDFEMERALGDYAEWLREFGGN
ncbi:MAG: NAD(P)-dependent oxidoreductase [Chloroflexota bacterium]